MQEGAGEVGSINHRLEKVRALQMGTGQVRLAQVRSSEIGTAKIRLGEIKSAHIQPAQTGSKQIRQFGLLRRGDDLGCAAVLSCGVCGASCIAPDRLGASVAI
jgi:hypothetical protein